MRTGLLPSHLIVDDGLIAPDFGKRIEAFKEATGVSWHILSVCLGVDPRQLQRWREGTKPSGDGVNALVKLAARVPGGMYILFGVHVLPPVGVYQPPLAVDLAASGQDREE